MNPLKPPSALKMGKGWLILTIVLIVVVIFALFTLIAALADRQGVRKAMAIKLGVWHAWFGRMKRPFSTPVDKLPKDCAPCSCDTKGPPAQRPVPTDGELEAQSMGVAQS